jgi:hypothetical protein
VRYTPHEMHAYEIHTHDMCACEVHAHEVHTYEVYAREVHAHEVHALAVHAHEGFCEDLARRNTVAHLSQLQLGFRHCRIWVSVSSHIGPCHRRSVLRPLFRTLHRLLGYQRSSTLFRPVCLSPVCPLLCRSDWLANPIACASFPRLALPLL